MNTHSKSIIKLTSFTSIISAMVVLSACSIEPAKPKLTTIEITNNSKSELSNVVISGSGFSQTVGNIPVGKKQSVFVRPSGESSVTMNFNANGKSHSSGKQGYFEPGYSQINLTIATDFKVKVDNSKI